MPSVRFRLNGVETVVDADPDRSLLDILRGPLGMTGPHFGCGAGECGACNVMIDGRAVSSCDTPLWSVADKDVTTVEGLGDAEHPHPLQRAFIAEQALQCGYCVPGILISAAALLKQIPSPSSAEVKQALDGNLCRCGSQGRMVRAVLRAAERDGRRMNTPLPKVAGEPCGEPKIVVVAEVFSRRTGDRVARARSRSGKAS